MHYPRSLSLVVAALIAVAALPAQVVPAGNHQFSTPNNMQSWLDFASNPVPANAFGAGSAPFAGVLFFEANPPLAANLTIRRDTDANLTGCPSADTIPITFWQLRMLALTPARITFPSGADGLYDVTLFAGTANGTATINRSHPDGGTYDMRVTLQLSLTFKKWAGQGPFMVTHPFGSVTLTSRCYWSDTDPFGYLFTNEGFYSGVEWVGAGCSTRGTPRLTRCVMTSPELVLDLLPHVPQVDCGWSTFCIGTTPRNSIYVEPSGGVPSVGGRVDLRASALPPNQAVLWVIGIARFAPPFPAFGAHVCVFPQTSTTNASSGAGVSTLSLPIPPGLGSIGRSLHWQVAALDSQAAFLFSNALTMVACAPLPAAGPR